MVQAASSEVSEPGDNAIGLPAPADPDVKPARPLVEPVIKTLKSYSLPDGIKLRRCEI
jgi:hypothetical protein